MDEEENFLFHPTFDKEGPKIAAHLYYKDTNVTMMQVYAAWLDTPRVSHVDDLYYRGRGARQRQLQFIEDDQLQSPSGQNVPELHKIVLDIYRLFTDVSSQLYDYGWSRRYTKLDVLRRVPSQYIYLLHRPKEMRDFQHLTRWLQDFDRALEYENIVQLQLMADSFDETFGDMVRIVYGLLTRDDPRRLPRSLASAPSREELFDSFNDIAELD